MPGMSAPSPRIPSSPASNKANHRDLVPAEAGIPQTVPWTPVLFFTILSCVLAWLVCIPLWVSGHGLNTPGFGILAAVMMFTPMLAAIVTMLIFQRRSWREALAYLGVWPLRPARRTLLFVVLAMVLMPVIIVVGIALAAMFGWTHLDLEHFSMYEKTLRTQGGMSKLPMPVSAFVVIQLVTLPITMIINAFLTVGEEVGWRGWLLPTLRPLGTWPALLISGAIWGFWHSPIILLGYNFDLRSPLGPVLMIVACMFLGVIVGWFRLRTGSVWPAVFAHAALNAAAGFLMVFADARDALNLVLAGPLGVASWITMAIVIIVLVVTGQLKKQPPLMRRIRTGESAQPMATPSNAPATAPATSTGQIGESDLT